jgi:hypothetical protein
MATVKNIKGTSDNDCKCRSWLNHWKNFSGQKLSDYCSEEKCINPPTVGAHVQRDTITDNNWYIVPLCDKHNKAVSSMNIVNSVVLVLANKAKTCG